MSMVIYGVEKPSNFKEWMVELRKIAAKNDGEFLISVSDNDDDHRESYIDGMTPQEEFDEQYIAGVQACA